MKKMLVTTAIILACGAATTALGDEPQPYRGWKMVSVDVATPAQMLALEQIATPLACVPHPGAAQEYAISGDAIAALDAVGAPYRVIDNDLQATFNMQAAQMQAARADRDATFFTTFRTIAEINAEMDALVAAYPTLATKIQMPVPAGFTANTIEGRTIYGLKITGTSTTPGNPANPVFFVNACQHAREWISPMTCMWAVEQLLGNYSSDTAIKNYVDNITWYFVPVVNVDGYIYTFPVAQGGQNQRLWRKNRHHFTGSNYGVDTNRNWAVGFGITTDGASSNSVSSDVYHGTAAFSEPETSSLRAFLLGLSGVKATLDLHSYSELVLGPWSYTYSALPANEAAVWDPLNAAVTAAIKNTYNQPYIGGQTSQILYLAAGVAGDWSFAPTGTTGSPGIHALGYGIELRDTGTYGFELPADQIVPTGVETFNGIKVIADYIQKRLAVTLSSPPGSLSENTAASFGVSIATFNNYTVGAASLKYRTTPSGSFTSVPLSGGSGAYTATIPAEPCGTTVQYYIEAVASDGAIVRSPAGAPGSLLSAATPTCVTPPCTGDVNGDHTVNSVDLGAMLANFGVGVTPGTGGDLNSDGTVNSVDLGILLSAFGTSCP